MNSTGQTGPNQSDSQQQATGLGTTPRDEWDIPTESQLEEKPIDRLAPGTDLHASVLSYLLARIKMSEDKMSALYPRWRMNEMAMQAYLTLPDYKKQYEDINKAPVSGKSKEPPPVGTIIIPYAYATCMTIATYMLHVFCGQKPMFQVSSNKAENVGGAENMETVLQYNADHCKLIGTMWQFLLDNQIYGLGVMRTTWKNETAMRTLWETQPPGPMADPNAPPQKSKTRKNTVVYSGNMVDNIDPFLFFPDPRVPMSKVNTQGEFCFWRVFDGRHNLKKLEADKIIKYVNSAGSLPTTNNGDSGGVSARNLGLGMDSSPGTNRAGVQVQPFIQVDQGTVEIIPAELGLGKSTRPEKWVFTILNKHQICQAEPFDLDHGQHPVCVAEPYSMGYGFGQPGAVDFIKPMQDVLSWLINSHIANVRVALNNMFVVDPTKIEMKDLTSPEPGKVIRLKPAAYGQDVRGIVAQLDVHDVTASHINDFELFMKLADSLTGVTDNVRGLQDAGGRKTATEVRTASEAGASRLAAQAMVTSSQAIVDLTRQMSLNIQQFMEDGIFLQVVGQDGIKNPIQISPEMLVGDFQYPVNDGTLPIDRVAMVDVWKEIFLGVAQSPQLAQKFDLVKIFKHLATLGGAKNIDSFEVKVMNPGEQPPPGAVPIQRGPGTVPQNGSGQTPGLSGAPPGDRLA